MSTNAYHDMPEADAVFTVVARCFGVDRKQLTAKTVLVEDLEIDSIDRLALAVDLEGEFGVVITDRDICCLRTIGDTIRYMVGLCELRRCERQAASLLQSIDEKPTQSTN